MDCVSPPYLVQPLVSLQLSSSRFKPGLLLCQRIYGGRDARKIPHKVLSLQFSERLFSFSQVFLLISQLETQKRPGQVLQRSAPISLLQYYSLRAVSQKICCSHISSQHLAREPLLHRYEHSPSLNALLNFPLRRRKM